MDGKKNEAQDAKPEERMLDIVEWKALSAKQYAETMRQFMQFDKQPTAKEWNIIAAQKGLLSSKTLQYITSTPFSRIWDKVQKGHLPKTIE